MTFIDKRHVHYFFDREQSPAATVKPGAEIVLETEDACGGEVRSTADFLRHKETGRLPGNPITGPIYVEGAAPGDTLVVEILKIELNSWGFQVIGPDRAVIRDEVPEWLVYEFEVKKDRVCFPNGMQVHADPVIGTIGNAPAGEPTNHPFPLGGNLDVPAIRTGAKVYLPVEVPGALFSLGDIHACQGDGEVVGAPEIAARVTVRLGVQPGRHSKWLMVEDALAWHSICSGPTEADGARLAVLQNGEFIARKYNIDFRDALIFLTLTGQLSFSRTGKWHGNLPSVACASFFKATLQKAIANYDTNWHKSNP